MKLIFENEFELQVQDETYTGIIKDLTKKEKKAIDLSFKEMKTANIQLIKHNTKIKKLHRKIEVQEKQENWDKVEILEVQLDNLELERENLNQNLEKTLDVESKFKKRLKETIISRDLENILKTGELYGYQLVFETIQEDVTERKIKK